MLMLGRLLAHRPYAEPRKTLSNVEPSLDGFLQEAKNLVKPIHEIFNII